MVALSASRLVCPATSWISLTTSPIFCAAFASEPICVVGGGGLSDRDADQIVGLAELAADLADRRRQLLGRRGRALDVDRGLVRGMDRTFGALGGLVGGGEQGRGGRAHRAGVVADGLQHALDALAEGRDRGVDRRAALLLRAPCGRAPDRRRRCSVMSWWVETQPPSGIGRLVMSIDAAVVHLDRRVPRSSAWPHPAA